MRLLFLATFTSSLGAYALAAQPPTHQLVTYSGFVENIAVRSNGHLLVTSLTIPSIHYLDPSHPDPATSLPPIPDANGISGITEVSHDVYAVAAGIWNTTARRGELGSFAVWTIDFRKSSTLQPKLAKIVDIDQTTALNGLTTIQGSEIVLASDSDLGLVYRIDVAKGILLDPIKDAAFAPTGPPPSLGINGVRVRDLQLYFSNSATGTYGSVPISRTGAATGPVRPISHFNTAERNGIDDLAIDGKENAWIAFHPDSVVKVDQKGQQTVIVNGTQVPDPTSLAFDRGSRQQEEILYVVTNVIGEQIIGGVAAVDTRGC